MANSTSCMYLPALYYTSCVKAEEIKNQKPKTKSQRPKLGYGVRDYGDYGGITEIGKDDMCFHFLELCDIYYFRNLVFNSSLSLHYCFKVLPDYEVIPE
jgi:hypothetical protein